MLDRSRKVKRTHYPSKGEFVPSKDEFAPSKDEMVLTKRGLESSKGVTLLTKGRLEIVLVESSHVVEVEDERRNQTQSSKEQTDPSRFLSTSRREQAAEKR